MEKYKIVIPHFYCLVYSEGARKITLEIDFREPEIVLSENMICNWDEPYDDEIISEEDKIRILNNIYSYLLSNNSKERVKIEEATL